MALRPIGRLPEGRRPIRRSMVESDVREFARNTLYDVAEVTVKGHDAKSVAVALRRYVKGHPDQCAGIAACLRDGRAYLYRKGAR